MSRLPSMLAERLVQAHWEKEDNFKGIVALFQFLLSGPQLNLAAVGTYKGKKVSLLVGVALLPFDAINTLTSAEEATLFQLVRCLPRKVHADRYNGLCAVEWMLAARVLRPMDSSSVFFRLLDEMLSHVESLSHEALATVYSNWFSRPQWLLDDAKQLHAFIDLLERHTLLTPERTADIYLDLHQTSLRWEPLLAVLLTRLPPRLEWVGMTHRTTNMPLRLLHLYTNNSLPGHAHLFCSAWEVMSRQVFDSLDQALGVTDLARMAHAYLFADRRYSCPKIK